MGMNHRRIGGPTERARDTACAVLSRLYRGAPSWHYVARDGAACVR